MTKTICLLLMIYSLFFHAQIINGTVMGEDKSKIRGAIVGVEGEYIGDITNEEGKFSIDLTKVDKNKSLIAYLGGYNPYRVSISDFIKQKTHGIILHEKTYNIEPINIGPRNLVEKNIGVNAKSKMRFSGWNSNRNAESFKEYAIRFKNGRKIKLKNINLNLSDYSIAKPIVIVFDIYSSKNDMPDKSLSLKPLSIEINSDSEIIDNMITLNIANENIWVNEDFFISVRVANDFDGYLYLSGNILAMFQKTYYRYFHGKWEQFTGGVPSINLDVLIKR